MDWERPVILFLAVPIALFFAWLARLGPGSVPAHRSRALLVCRAVCCALLLLALADPRAKIASSAQTVLFLLDRSGSMGPGGRERSLEAYRQLKSKLSPRTAAGVLTVAAAPEIVQLPDDGDFESLPDVASADQGSTHLESALRLAVSLFPPRASSHVVLLSDGQETAGDLLSAAGSAALKGVRVHVLPVVGDQQPDARIIALTPSLSRIHQGATLGLHISAESSVDGTAQLRLFESGVEIERQSVSFSAGKPLEFEFHRNPSASKLFTYRAAFESISFPDALPANDEASAVVDVVGPPRILYVEGEPDQAHYLVDAMAAEDIVCQVASPPGIPARPDQLAGYEAVILSDVEARQLSEPALRAIRSYVEDLGGGFVMLGGPHAFDPGGYRDTPIEEMLPVKLERKDQEQDPVTALALVIDRSGSMTGEKLRICKSASLATAELLREDDFIGIYAFDSSVHPVLPMTRAGSRPGIGQELDLVSAGGGTNIYPAMSTARDDLKGVIARTKHMIVLSDGQTLGQGYEALAANSLAEGVTISTVAVGEGADRALLERIASAGGGKSYFTRDPSGISRIFTQDTILHTRRSICEEPFQPVLGEPHPMVAGWNPSSAPPLLGFVKTEKRPSAQVLLSTGKEGDAPLLAHWRFGHGRVTAFTSDCKARWAVLWLRSWPDGYSRMWSQILRETMRSSSAHRLDLRVESLGEQIRIQADLLANAGTRINQAIVRAGIFRVVEQGQASNLQLVQEVPLRQSGPGLYETSFLPENPGTYVVRAQSGSDSVTATHLHQPPRETASGQINAGLLRQVAEVTGGQFLSTPAFFRPLDGAAVERSIPLWPVFGMLLLSALLAGVVLRRWDAAVIAVRAVRSWWEQTRSRIVSSKP